MLRERAQAGGIHFDTLDRYQHIPDRSSRHLVIGYGNITPNGIEEAVAQLAGLLADQPGRAKGRPGSPQSCSRPPGAPQVANLVRLLTLVVSAERLPGLAVARDCVYARWFTAADLVVEMEGWVDASQMDAEPFATS